MEECRDGNFGKRGRSRIRTTDNQRETNCEPEVDGIIIVESGRLFAIITYYSNVAPLRIYCDSISPKFITLSTHPKLVWSSTE